MIFQSVRNLHKLLIAFRKILFQSGNGLRGTDTGHHILALGIDQVLAVNALRASGRISGEGHARSRGVSHISKYHGLYVYRRAPIAGDVIHTSVYNRSLIIPGTEYGLHRLHQLYSGILRELLALVFLINIFKSDNNFLHVVRRQIGVILYALGLFDLIQNPFKIGLGNLHNHIGEHLNKSAVRIISKAGISCLLRKTFYSRIRQTQIQNGVHHARHGSPCPGTHRNKKRTFGISKLLALFLFQICKRRKNLLFDLIRNLSAVVVIVRACLRGHGKALRNRQSQICHLRQIRSFSPEKITHVRVSLLKQIYPFRHIFAILHSRI